MQKIDEQTDIMADQAVESVRSGLSNMSTAMFGYARNMFFEEEEPSEAMLVQGSGDLMPLDRVQAVAETEESATSWTAQTLGTTCGNS